MLAAHISLTRHRRSAQSRWRNIECYVIEYSTLTQALHHSYFNRLRHFIAIFITKNECQHRDRHAIKSPTQHSFVTTSSKAWSVNYTELSKRQQRLLLAGKQRYGRIKQPYSHRGTLSQLARTATARAAAARTTAVSALFIHCHTNRSVFFVYTNRLVSYPIHNVQRLQYTHTQTLLHSVVVFTRQFSDSRYRIPKSCCCI